MKFSSIMFAVSLVAVFVPLSAHGGFCRPDSPKRACESCRMEADCGGKTGDAYCQAKAASNCRGRHVAIVRERLEQRQAAESSELRTLLSAGGSAWAGTLSIKDRRAIRLGSEQLFMVGCELTRGDSGVEFKLALYRPATNEARELVLCHTMAQLGRQTKNCRQRKRFKDCLFKVMDLDNDGFSEVELDCSYKEGLVNRTLLLATTEGWTDSRWALEVLHEVHVWDNACEGCEGDHSYYKMEPWFTYEAARSGAAVGGLLTITIQETPCRGVGRQSFVRTEEYDIVRFRRRLQVRLRASGK